jgi:menaquinol-cytochrome c reductase iron-sulfur subunit
MTDETGRHDGLGGGLSTPVGGRRSFFAWMTGAAVAVIGLGLAIPLAGYVISPALKRRERAWVDIGAAGEIAEGAPTQLNYMATVRDGWVETKAQKAVWAVKRPDGTVTVFSPICPHLGCGYRWDHSDRAFKCHCHGIVFDADGNVVAGPAPRALDTLPSKIEQGRLLIVYQEFKAGLPRKVEL